MHEAFGRPKTRLGSRSLPRPAASALRLHWGDGDHHLAVARPFTGLLAEHGGIDEDTVQSLFALANV